MNVKSLIRKFSAREIMPVDVQDDVIPELMRARPYLKLWFWHEEINTDILKGQINHWQYDDLYGNTVDCIDIGYAKSLPLEWQRLVCCKELIHILDPIDCRIMTDEEFERLCEKIVLPTDLQDPVTDGVPVWNDRLAVFQAVAILFPWTCRQLFKAPFDQGKISAETIAEKVDIPVRFVRLVMSRHWEVIHRMLADEQ